MIQVKNTIHLVPLVYGLDIEYTAQKIRMTAEILRAYCVDLQQHDGTQYGNKRTYHCA